MITHKFLQTLLLFHFNSGMHILFSCCYIKPYEAAWKVLVSKKLSFCERCRVTVVLRV